MNSRIKYQFKTQIKNLQINVLTNTIEYKEVT